VYSKSDLFHDSIIINDLQSESLRYKRMILMQYKNNNNNKKTNHSDGDIFCAQSILLNLVILG